ncbi:MAG: hypothetical protein KKC85_22135 [Gammaproteobacteria bacterium]|nr:hypothetical protein [Gammaproteobacteria bacterium]MBU1443658.1 hypothetical protein [Gammaproteobacteria bacterium]MBU2289106.1 hypothetical protein [Gammaproteobacteria bacterium]
MKTSTPPPKPLDEVLESTHDVASEVQKASDDLAVVHTVLEQEVPKDAQAGDVAQAIAHTGEIERKLAKSADQLVEANQALAEEIERLKSAQAPARRTTSASNQSA